MASIRFDFPDPLGPMMTFSGVSGIASASGGKERNPDNLIDFRNDMTDLACDFACTVSNQCPMPFTASQRSQSSAAWQPEPAAVTACL